MTLKNLFSHTLKCLHSTHLYDKSEFPRNVPDTTPLAVQRLFARNGVGDHRRPRWQNGLVRQTL